MTKLALVVAVAGACAGSRSVPVVAPNDGARIEPQALQHRVPTVDRISYAVRMQMNGIAAAELDLCVAPAGDVVKVTLAKSSSMTEFDAALLRDARRWKFSALPGPTSVQGCRRHLVEYRAH